MKWLRWHMYAYSLDSDWYHKELGGLGDWDLSLSVIQFNSSHLPTYPLFYRSISRSRSLFWVVVLFLFLVGSTLRHRWREGLS